MRDGDLSAVSIQGGDPDAQLAQFIFPCRQQSRQPFDFLLAVFQLSFKALRPLGGGLSALKDQGCEAQKEKKDFHKLCVFSLSFICFPEKEDFLHGV